MIRSLNKNLYLLFPSLLPPLVATFNHWSSNSDIRLVSLEVRGEEKQRAVEIGSRQVSSPTARQGNSTAVHPLSGGAYADR